MKRLRNAEIHVDKNGQGVLAIENEDGWITDNGVLKKAAGIKITSGDMGLPILVAEDVDSDKKAPGK